MPHRSRLYADGAGGIGSTGASGGSAKHCSAPCAIGLACGSGSAPNLGTRQIRGAIGAATIDLALLTAAERLQYEGYLHREEANAAILALTRDGITIKQIVRRTGHSRGLLRKVVRSQRSDVFRTRESSLDVHLAWLDAQWMAGQRNGAELWGQLKQHGFRGSHRVAGEWRRGTDEQSRRMAAR